MSNIMTMADVKVWDIFDGKQTVSSHSWRVGWTDVNPWARFDMTRQLGQCISETARLMGCFAQQYLSTVVWRGTNHKLVKGYWAPKAHWCTRAINSIPSGPNWKKGYCDHRNFLCYWRNVWQHSVWGCVAADWPMLTPVHHWKLLQWAHLHQDCTLEQWTKFAWSDFYFLLHHVDVHVCHLPGKVMAPEDKSVEVLRCSGQCSARKP